MIIGSILKRYGAVLLCVIICAACGGEDEGAKWSTDIRDAQDPTGNTPFKDSDVAMVRKALKSVRIEIDKFRVKGIQQIIDELKIDLAANGIDTAILDKIDDSIIGKGMGASGLDTSAAKSDGIGTQSYGLTQADYATYYTCPIEAPEDGSPETCENLVTAIVDKVKLQINSQKAEVEKLIKDTYSDLTGTAQQFIASWCTTAQQYGAEVAATYAKYELKASSACESTANGNAVSFSLGREQGWQIVLGLRAWALSQVDTCAVNTDAIAEQVRIMARGQVDGFIEENKVCEDADLSTINEVLREGEVKRREGIMVGIDERVEILRNELFQARATAPCGGGDGGGGDGGGGGEPLVIDLDGDGLVLTAHKLSFDLLGNGNKQAVTWVGRGDGLLAVDLDGDGMIGSGAELMSNVADCGGRACYDGVDALRAYDSTDRGGNGDGVIDHRDKVFSRLLVWVDRNQDAVSQPGELASLEDHGIRSINLEATQIMNSMVGGTLSAQMDVLTDDGFRTAYDAWFRMDVSTEDLPALMPGK